MNNQPKNNPPRDGKEISLWQSNVVKPEITDIPHHYICDVVIVGGGITGITTALLLQQQGKKCIIAEGRTIGFGTTGGTSAHLNTFFDATYPDVEQDFGRDSAKLLAQAGKEAISTINCLIEQYHIQCDFELKDAFLFSENEKESKQLEKILKASIAAGIQASQENDNGIPMSFDMSVLFKDQGQFHPLKYIYKLAEVFINLGGIIVENTFIKENTYENGVHIVQSEKTRIKADHLVFATHIPPGITPLNFTCAPYRSYVLGVQLKDGQYADHLIYDMKEPYHYFRSHIINGQTFLLVGGEDHKTGHSNPETAFKNLEEYVRKYFSVSSIDYKWSSQYYIPVDGLPYIGQAPASDENIYIATGFNGNGMIFGTLSAQIISDQIMGTDNIYTDLFSPSRIKPIAGFTDFVKENADVAYRFLADRFSVEELDSLEAIEPEQGIIAELNGKKLAIYKDQQGHITALNPVCSHAGCIVQFNNIEKSWDCPCHGARYDVNGEVLTGPARNNLKKHTPN
jgi:glycine/D-amino acid oxidase-like deaminating enzyme/nitrite reductase/ring-hydroxylating ferredoxin subunit